MYTFGCRKYCEVCLSRILPYFHTLGKGGATKTDKSSEKFQMAFDPPPHFRKIMLQIFYNGYGYIYARRHRPESIS